MARLLIVAASLSALTTLVAAMALRAADATLAVGAIAAVAVLFAWYAQLHATDQHASLGLTGPASSVALAVVGRRPWATLLPEIAAHAVGGVLGGLGALALDDRLGDPLVFADPGLVTAAAAAGVVAILGAWATLAVDGGGPEALVAVPVVVGGAIVPLGLVAVFQPAAVIGLATAGLVPWDAALVAAGVGLVAPGIGALAVTMLVPAEGTSG